MGGETALNIASELSHDGSLERLGVELIGSDLDAIDKAEDRELFNQVCESIQLPISEAIACNSMQEVISTCRNNRFLAGFDSASVHSWWTGWWDGLGHGSTC